MTESPDPDVPTGPRIHDIRAFRNSFLGVGLLVCVTFLIFGTWELYGAAGALPQAALWVVLFALSCRWFVKHPRRVLVLGGISLAVWVAVVLLHQ